MDTDEVERRIEAEIPDAEAEVTLPRVPDEDHEDAHFAAVIVSPAFEGKTLVQQHQMVYDALGDAMTTEIHALEMQTYTPEEYRERS
ncbi:BolA family protein [Halobellus limi]|uniref:BolA family transcriptional regulator n=1 Tax=Halobellus limi TaxID=699433 RepID=A0A1H6AJU1_9EURY|nr:BolA family protein [Halobellus limi]QCC47607.1 BolA family transcriptional regulator [Halobellus limi]SEG48424.1 transcriptional regulator, BolA protein family [Halobellus limi]